MAGTRLSDAELNDLTGVPVPEEMTPGKAVISALKDTLGYAIGPGALQSISNKEALQKATKVVKDAYRLHMQGSLKPKTLRKEYLGTRSAMIDEIQGAPEGIYTPVKDIRFDPNEVGAHYRDADSTITMGPGFTNPRILRHENAHGWQRTFDDPDMTKIRESSYLTRYTVPGQSYYTGKPIVEQKMDKYLAPENFRSPYHSVAATELNAVHMENIPPSKFKSLDDYVKTIAKNLVEAAPIQKERMQAARRFQKLARLPNPYRYASGEPKFPFVEIVE
jgi:hypothetical protein